MMPNPPSADPAVPPPTGGEPDHAGSQPAAGAAVDRLAALSTLADLPLHEHVEVYRSLHADLQASLAEIDSA